MPPLLTEDPAVDPRKRPLAPDNPFADLIPQPVEPDNPFADLVKAAKPSTYGLEPAPPAAAPVRRKPGVYKSPIPSAVVAPTDVTDITKKAEHTLGHHMPGAGESLPGALVESAMEMVTKPHILAKELIMTAPRAGAAWSDYHKGTGTAKEAALKTLQTIALGAAGPAEKAVAERLVSSLGRRLAETAATTAVGAGTGAAFTPDRPAIGAILGAAGGVARLPGAIKDLGDVSAGAVEAGAGSLKAAPPPPVHTPVDQPQPLSRPQEVLRARLATEGVVPAGPITRRPAPVVPAPVEPPPDATAYSTKSAVRRPAAAQPERRPIERRTANPPDRVTWTPEERSRYITDSQKAYAAKINKPWSQWTPEEKAGYFANQTDVRAKAPWQGKGKPELPTGNPDEIPTIEALKYVRAKLGPEGFRKAVEGSSRSAWPGTIAAQTGNVERTVREIVRQDQIAAKHTEPRTYVPSSDPASVEPENARVRSIAEQLKTNPSDQVVREAADEMAGRVPEGAVLVPLPGHTGVSTGNVRLAQEIAKRVPNTMVLPVVERSRPVPSSTANRRAGQAGVDVEAHVASLRATGGIPKDRPVILVDNVETTGATGEAARRVLQRPDAKTVTYAKAPIPPGEASATGAVTWPPLPKEGDLTPVVSSNSEFEARPGVMRAVNRGEQPAALNSPLRLPEPTAEDRAIVQPKGYKEISPEEVAARKPAPVAEARPKEAQPATVDENGLFFEHRTPGGDLRPFNRVSTEGLIKAHREMQEQIIRDQQLAVYRNVEADVSGTQYGVNIQAATKTARGTSQQAEAAERLRNYEKVMTRLDEELAKRGMSSDDVYDAIQRQEEHEAAIEQEAIHHADLADEADTAFGDFEDLVPEKTGKSGPAPTKSIAEKEPPVSDVLNVAKLNLGDRTAEQRMAAKLEEFRSQREANRQTFAEADVNRAEILNELRAGDPLALPTEKAKKLSGEELLARRDLVRENDEIITSLSKRLEQAATPEEHAQLETMLQRAVDHTDALLSDLVTGSSQKGRDLNLLRRIANRNLDPDVWRIQAKRMLGDRPYTAEIDAQIRRLANEGTDACG